MLTQAQKEHIILNAFKQGNLRVIFSLIRDRVLDVNHLFLGVTLLHMAAHLSGKKSAELIHFLMNHGASTTIMDDKRKDPVHYAIDIQNGPAIKTFSHHYKIQNHHYQYALRHFTDTRFLSFLKRELDRSVEFEMDFELLFNDNDDDDANSQDSSGASRSESSPKRTVYSRR